MLSLKEIVKATPIMTTEYFNLYKITLGNFSFNLYVSCKKATKRTHIHCYESGDVVWEDLYPFGGMSRPSSVKNYALKPKPEFNFVTIVVVRGNPQSITGLDDGAIKSCVSEFEPNQVYLMTEKEFEVAFRKEALVILNQNDSQKL